jgi:hypothetical protein
VLNNVREKEKKYPKKILEGVVAAITSELMTA